MNSEVYLLHVIIFSCFATSILADSSMTKFLTSPRISQELHLHVTSTQSVQAFATASAEPSGASTLQGSAQARGSVQLHERGKIEGRFVYRERPVHIEIDTATPWLECVVAAALKPTPNRIWYTSVYAVHMQVHSR